MVIQFTQASALAWPLAWSPTPSLACLKVAIDERAKDAWWKLILVLLACAVLWLLLHGDLAHALGHLRPHPAPRPVPELRHAVRCRDRAVRSLPIPLETTKPLARSVDQGLSVPNQALPAHVDEDPPEVFAVLLDPDVLGRYTVLVEKAKHVLFQLRLSSTPSQVRHAVLYCYSCSGR